MDETTPLQRFISAAVERMPNRRDHYDRLLQERLGTKGKPIYDIARGKSKKPSLQQLEAIAEVLGQPRELFERAIMGEGVKPIEPGTSPTPGNPTVEDIVPADDVVHIQKLDLSLSMGPGTHIDDWVEAEPVAFDLAFIQAITRTPSDRLKLVTGIGDSMYPTLNWGDVILIDTTDKQLARQDGVYWIDIYGAAGLKRLRNVGRERVLIISDNPNVPDQEVDTADLRIQGRAIWLARGI